MNYKQLLENAKNTGDHFDVEFLNVVKSCQRWVRILKKQTNKSQDVMIKDRISDQVKTIKCFLDCLK